MRSSSGRIRSSSEPTHTRRRPATDLSRQAIVEGLRQIVGTESVVTDEQELRRSSVDNFRKLERIFGVYTRPLPAAVVMAHSTAEVAEVLAFAEHHGVNVVPRTGGTATEGGLETAVADSIVLDGSAMDRILSIDAYDMQAVCQCGVPLQVLEDRAREQGLTTGHSPQSKPVARMGGLVATRSIGQFSTLYGGIEDLVVGLEAVFPGGRVARIKNVPRRAVGPDIRHVVIGNEGALCFITEVTVKLFPYFPENDVFLGWRLKSMKTGFEALREVMVNGFRPSVARLYDPGDAGLHFSHLAGPDDCVLLFMAEGPAGIARATAEGIEAIVSGLPGLERVDGDLIAAWFDDLVWGPDKIAGEDERIRRTRNVNRTTEVAAGWSSIHDVYESSLRRIVDEIPDLTMAGGHSSHSYVNGTNMYFNYFYDVVDCEPEDEVAKYYLPIIAIICEETLRRGGAIVHHHGVGKARTPWVAAEYGSSYAVLETLKHAFDPSGIMNKGTIIPG
jgi:alkyldihydroxyacetonephosphate synthase